MVADYHALDSLDEIKNFNKTIYDTARWLIAVGIKPERSIIFRQSQISQHTELAWIFSSLTPVGELERMTQYKDKSTGVNSTSASLLTYPVLMAADILIYKAIVVPVGEDQTQHLELTRTIARKFNQKFGSTFPEPKPLLTKTAKIMSLKNPDKKMSKTGDDGIALADSPALIRRKIMAAVTATDSGRRTMPAGVANLFNLLISFSPNDGKEFLAKYKKGDLKYAELKSHLADKIIEHLKPAQDHFAQISDRQIEQVLADGQEKATRIANTTLHEVKEKIGLI